MDKSRSCSDCSRDHREDQPCPRRLARAIANPAFASAKALTDSDKHWLVEHMSPNKIEDLLEEALADKLE